MRAYSLLSYYMKICVQWKSQDMDSHKEDWLKLFKVKSNPSIVFKFISFILKWTIRIFDEAFKVRLAHQQYSTIFFDGTL
jgi:hypothetical protein